MKRGILPLDVKKQKKIDRLKNTRKNVGLPVWVLEVNRIRTTQVPPEYRPVFDIEADPRFFELLTGEKVKHANFLVQLTRDDPATKPETLKKLKDLTVEDYEFACAYFSQHRSVAEAINVMYRNKKVMLEFREDFDKVYEKARAHSDPTKMLAVWRAIDKLNFGFGEQFVLRELVPPREKKPPATDSKGDGFVPPNYWDIKPKKDKVKKKPQEKGNDEN